MHQGEVGRGGEYSRKTSYAHAAALGTGFDGDESLGWDQKAYGEAENLTEIDAALPTVTR